MKYQMKRSLFVVALVPLLLGATYQEPSENYATVEFSQTGSPQASFHRNGSDCSGMVNLPNQKRFFNASAAPLRVDAGQAVAFKLFQLKGQSTFGLEGCQSITSFVPSPGAKYRVHLDGDLCRVEVFRTALDGSEVRDPSSRSRKMRMPFLPSGPFCEKDA